MNQELSIDFTQLPCHCFPVYMKSKLNKSFILFKIFYLTFEAPSLIGTSVAPTSELCVAAIVILSIIKI